jgi:hypothetical protein
MNWRKPVILAPLRCTGSWVPTELALIRQIEFSPDGAAEAQRSRLRELLRHAWEQVPYYREVLESCGAGRAGGSRPLQRYPIANQGR